MSVCHNSKLVEEIIALETDFKYNLDLLRVRESEIDRCTKTNQSLQVSLNSTLSELHSLNMKYLGLKATVQNIETDKQKECEHYKLQKEMLEEHLNKALEREYRTRAEHERDLKQLEEKLAKSCEKQLEVQKRVHEKLNMDLQKKYNAQSKSIQQLQEKLQETVNENIELQDKVRRLESQRVADACYYKSEKDAAESKLAEMQGHIDSLTNDAAALKEKIESLTRDNRTLQENRDELAGRLNFVDKQNENLKSLNKHLMEKLDQQMAVAKESEKEIKVLTYDKNKLAEQLKNSRSATFCNMPGHASFESVVRQNGILQEIIKEAKRNKAVQRKGSEVHEAEAKIGYLERLVEHLKRIIISNHELKAEDLDKFILS